MEETVVDERTYNQACQNVRKRIRERDGPYAVGDEVGLDGSRKERSNGSGDQEGIIEVFPKHGF